MTFMRSTGRIALCLVIIGVSGCNRAKSSPAAKTPPSVVAKEDQLTTIELTDEAVKRLGIETASVSMRNVPRRRLFGGEVVLPPGAIVVVSAPIFGKLQAPAGRELIRPGADVVQKQPVLALLPVLTPAEKIALATQLADAEGQVQQARSNVEANRIDLNRAEQLKGTGVGLGKTLDDAKAKLDLSQKALDAALSRQNVLAAAKLDGDSIGDQKPIMIETPESGKLSRVLALPDQFVTAGAPLFEVMKTDTVWVRVPIYVGEFSDIAPHQPAEIGDLAGRPGQPLVTAQWIDAPETGTAISSTIDLYYQLPNPQSKLRPQQRVSARLPLTGDASQKVIPWSAVVEDINGGNWIYEQLSERKFARRRVQVKQVVDGLAILDQGPGVGTTIVITGTAELFGAEFGVGK